MLQLTDTNAVNLGQIVPEVQATIGSYLDHPLGELDVAAALRRMLAIATRHGLMLPKSVVALFKQLLYLDGVCRSQQPGFDLLDGGASILAGAESQPTLRCRRRHGWPLGGEFAQARSQRRPRGAANPTSRSGRLSAKPRCMTWPRL